MQLLKNVITHQNKKYNQQLNLSRTQKIDFSTETLSHAQLCVACEYDGFCDYFIVILLTPAISHDNWELNTAKPWFSNNSFLKKIQFPNITHHNSPPKYAQVFKQNFSFWTGKQQQGMWAVQWESICYTTASIMCSLLLKFAAPLLVLFVRVNDL